jgi:hypothetical protein
LGKMGYKLETTALISKWNYNVFRIRCIMLILEILNKSYSPKSGINIFLKGIKALYCGLKLS